MKRERVLLLHRQNYRHTFLLVFLAGLSLSPTCHQETEDQYSTEDIEYLVQNHIGDHNIYLDTVALRQVLRDYTFPDTTRAKLLTEFANKIYWYGDWERSTHWYDSAIVAFEALVIQPHAYLTHAYTSAARAYLKNDQCEKAAFYAENAYTTLALHGSELPADVRNEVLIQMGWLERCRNDYESAKVFSHQALKALGNEKEKYPFHLGQTLIEVGKGYRSNGEYLKAIDYYKEALEVLIEVCTEKSGHITTVQDELSACYNFIGDYQKGLQHANKAIEITVSFYTHLPLEKREWHPGMGEFLRNSAVGHSGVGDWERADSKFELALDEQERHELLHNERTTGMRIDLVKNALKLGDIAKAQNQLHVALASEIENGRGSDLETVPEIYLLLAEVYQRKGELDSTRVCLNKARTILVPFKDSAPHKWNFFLLKSGDLAFANGELRKARRLYREAHKHTGDQPLRAPVNLFLRLAKTELALNDYSEADNWLNLLLKDVQQNAQGNWESYSSEIFLGYHATRASINYRKYGRTKQQEDLISAVEILESASTEIYKFSALVQDTRFLIEQFIPLQEKLLHWYDELFNITGDGKYHERAFQQIVQFQALRLNQAVSSKKLVSSDPTLNARVELLKSIEVRINYLERELLTNIELDSVRRIGYEYHLEDQKRAQAALLDTLEQFHAAYFQQRFHPQPTQLAALQRALQDSQRAIIYYCGNASVRAFTIGPSSYQYQFIGELSELLPTLKAYEELLGHHPEEFEETRVTDYFELGNRLRRQLFDVLPIPDHVDLEIIPSGPLANLSFSSLPLGNPADLYNFSSYRYLLQEYAINYQFSVQLLLENMSGVTKSFDIPYLALAPYADLPQTEKNRDMVAGDTATLSGLQFSEVEVNYGKQSFNGEVLLNKAATRASLFEKAVEANILHFATHAYSDAANPNFSALYLWNTGGETTRIFTKDLYTQNLSTELVVIAACHSGHGGQLPGEGTVNLGYGFQRAGALSVYTSIWSLNDIVSSELIRLFFANLSKGMSKPHALRKAQIDFIKEHAGQTISFPSAWGGLILFGNSAPLHQDLIK